MNRKFFESSDTPAQGQLLGWWGHEESTRFKMDNNFRPAVGADSFRLSNGPVLSLVCLVASLRVFSRTSIEAVRERSLQLTRRLMEFVDTSSACASKISVINHREDYRRGGHVSLAMNLGATDAEQEIAAKKALSELESRGFLVDYRAPGVLRVAPSPLYNTDEDVDLFCCALEHVLRSL